MKASDKLRAYWSKKENDLILYHPLGVATKSDAAYLCHLFANAVEELESRGYDKATFRFSIEPKKGNERFASEREKMPDQEDR